MEVMKHFILTASLVLSSTVYAAKPACPDSINTKQSLKNKVQEWLEFRSEDGTILKSIEFYDGNPFKKIHLAPDNAEKGASEQVWTFQKNQEIWQLCRYTNTNITLTKQMPAGLKTCTVKNSATVSPKVDDVTCK
jgi:hypothetical protein